MEEKDPNKSPSPSVSTSCPDSVSKLNDLQLNDLNQQLPDLNEQADDDLLLGSNCLVIEEHKTPTKQAAKKTPSKGKGRCKSSKKELANPDMCSWNQELDSIISENAIKSNLSTMNVKQILKVSLTKK